VRTLAAAVVLGLIGCGRIGYDPIEVGGDAGIDTPDVEPGIYAACNTAIDLGELPVPAGETVRALELGATTLGVIAAWTLDSGVWASAFLVSPTQHVLSLQVGEEVTDYGTTDVSLASNGDLAVLSVSHHESNEQHFHPLGADGRWRASPKLEENVHSHGNAYMVAAPADPDRPVEEGLYGVTTSNAGETLTLEREIDSHPWTNPVVTFAGIVAETTAVARLGDGYAVISGRPEQCDIVAVGGNLAPLGPVQVMDMTCHNAQIVNTVDDHVVAAWNCDDQQVWITGGSMGGMLPPHRSLYGTDGDTANAPSNPRLAPTSAGVWYGFQIVGGRLGRALVDDDGLTLDSVEPGEVVSAGVTAYDLLARDDEAYLFWTVADATTHLWAMRLCAP
jgi:hypothetical protein